MNAYLFCTLIFILLMISCHAASLYPSDQQLVEESNGYVRTDELNFIFDSDDKNIAVTTTQEPMEQIHVEALIDKNFTYHAILVTKATTELLCQGAVIDPLWIVTSAACLKKFSMSYDSLNVFTGFNLPQVVVSDIKQVYAYPEYQFLSNQNDIALVELESPIMNNEVVPVSLTRQRDPQTNRCDYSAIYNNTMVAFRVDMVNPHDCMRPEIPKQMLYYYCAGVSGKQMLLTEDDLLGVPLVCDGQLYGIKSLSTLFTSVPDVYDWISAKLNHQPYRVDSKDLPQYVSPELTSQVPSSTSELEQSVTEGNKDNKSVAYVPVAEDHSLNKFHAGHDVNKEDTTHLIITIGNQKTETTTHTSYFFNWYLLISNDDAMKATLGNFGKIIFDSAFKTNELVDIIVNFCLAKPYLKHCVSSHQPAALQLEKVDGEDKATAPAPRNEVPTVP